eukprot:PhF_6_TR24778/c0_g1_i2/m.34036
MPGPVLAPDRKSYQGIGMLSACSDGYLPIVILLWGQGESLTIDENGFTPLHFAALNGHVHVMRFLLSQKVDVDALGHDGSTPLMRAALGGFPKACQLLLDHGAVLSIQDKRGYTAMHHAIHGDRPDTLHTLVLADTTKSVHAMVDVENHSIFHWSAYRGCMATVRYCVEVLHMNVNALDNDQRNPLHWASLEGRKHAVRYLLAKGSNITADRFGLTPETEARGRHHLDAAAVFAQFRVAQSNGTSFVAIEPSPITSWQLLTARPGQWIHIFLAAALVLLLFGVSHFVPIYLLLGSGYLYVSKLRLRKFTGPKEGQRENPDKYDQMSNLSRYAFGGSINHYYRDLWNLSGLTVMTLIQLSLGLYGTEISSVVFPSSGEAPPCAYLKTIVYASVLAMVVGTVLVKVKIPKHYPLITNSLSEWSFMSSIQTPTTSTQQHCFVTGNRKPLRSQWVPEINSVVIRFDHFSYWLDAAVGLGNLPFYWLGVCGYIAFQMSNIAMLWTWCSHGAGGLGSKDPTDGLVWNLFVHFTPCGANKPTDPWYGWLSPAQSEILGFWLLVFPSAVTALLVSEMVEQVRLAASNVTSAEKVALQCPGEGGRKVLSTNPAMKKGFLYSSVYSEGKGKWFRNIMVSLGLQQPYRAWDTMDELPRSLWLHK